MPSDPTTLPAPPAGLSDAATALWTDWVTQADEDDVDLDAREITVLTTAVQHLTLSERLAAAVDELDSLTVEVTSGVKMHPLVSELDKERRTVSTLLASIKRVDRSATNSANVATRYRGTPR